MKRHLTEKVKRLREYVPVVGSAYRKLRELRESRQQVVRQLNEVLNQRAELDRHLDEAQRQHTELTRQLDEAQRQRTELGRQLDQAQSQRAELGRQLDEAKRDRAQLLEYLDISPYSRWIREHEGQRQANLNVPGLMPGLGCPKISVILTVCDPEPDYLARAVESVTKQSNRNWELCIADDASCRADVRALLVQMAANDCRVKVLFRDERGGFSAANNSAFKLVTAEFVTFLDHADLLAPRSLELCAAFLALHPETEILYSDEDEIDEYERRSRPYFKPDYSPELIHSCNYMSHLTVHRAKNIESVDGWRSAYDGAEDYDLLLRILDLVDGKDVRHLLKFYIIGVRPQAPPLSTLRSCWLGRGVCRIHSLGAVLPSI
jgi:flagellar biosynthesis chaperone FliJ